MTGRDRLRTGRAVVELAVAQLGHDRSRSVLAVLGVTLAVLSTTLLASVGYGVVATGEEKFTAADRDIWITGGPVRLAPGSVGGFETSLHDVHTLSADLIARESVQTAPPLSFQTLYAGSNPDDLETLVGVGLPVVGGGSVRISEGRGIPRSPHYADGSYDGPMTREVVVDERTARLLDVSVGETLYVGGTTLGARQNEVTVVGISPTFGQFLGAPTIAMPLAELQTLTGTARTDSATLVTVSLAPGVDGESMEQELQAAYPDYDVRTNREQLRAVLADRALVLAAGVVLVVLAAISGFALTVNLLALVVYQQRSAISAVRAIGVSARTLVGVVVVQGLVLGVLGGAVGLGLTPLLGGMLNRVALAVVGFEGLVRTPAVVYLGGGVLAVAVGAASAAVAGWRVARMSPLRGLRP